MGDIGNIIFLVVLLVLLVGLFVFSYMRKKKYNTTLNQMRDELKIGDKVMTDSGIVGEVEEIFEEDEYKYVVLKTGKGGHIGYATVHANAVYHVFEKETTTETKEEAKTETEQESKDEKNK